MSTETRTQKIAVIFDSRSVMDRLAFLAIKRYSSTLDNCKVEEITYDNLQPPLASFICNVGKVNDVVVVLLGWTLSEYYHSDRFIDTYFKTVRNDKGIGKLPSLVIFRHSPDDVITYKNVKVIGSSVYPCRAEAAWDYFCGHVPSTIKLASQALSPDSKNSATSKTLAMCLHEMLTHHSLFDWFVFISPDTDIHRHMLSCKKSIDYLDVMVDSVLHGDSFRLKSVNIHAPLNSGPNPYVDLNLDVLFISGNTLILDHVTKVSPISDTLVFCCYELQLNGNVYLHFGHNGNIFLKNKMSALISSIRRLSRKVSKSLTITHSDFVKLVQL